MVTPDPVSLMILTQTVGFLFGEAGKLLEERRAARKERGEKDEAKVSNNESSLDHTETISSPDKLNSLKPNTLQLQDMRDEMEHCLSLIHQYRENKRLLETQAAQYGGFASAPLITQNQIKHAEQEIYNNCQKLKRLVEEVYNREIIIKGLE